MSNASVFGFLAPCRLRWPIRAKVEFLLRVLLMQAVFLRGKYKISGTRVPYRRLISLFSAEHAAYTLSAPCLVNTSAPLRAAKGPLLLSNSVYRKNSGIRPRSG